MQAKPAVADGTTSPETLRARARAVRTRIRRGEFTRRTSGQAPGALQANVVILPEEWAEDFLRFCRANPKPCPVVAVSAPGDPRLLELGEDIDIRTDVPMYRMFECGKATAELPDITALWRSDFVTFALGCSFSFEEALVSAGIPLRHLDRDTDVAIFRTNIETITVGPFSGPLVVSMRPFLPADAFRAIQITSQFPRAHGAPVHLGAPAAIGIAELARPDWGETVPVEPGEIPLFWACGVTPQVAVANARPPICFTHKPSHMLVTDRLNEDFAIPDMKRWTS